MEICKTDDETLKKIANEINKTGVVKEKKDIRKDKKHTLEEKILKSTISSNSKDVIKRTIKIDKGDIDQVDISSLSKQLGYSDPTIFFDEDIEDKPTISNDSSKKYHQEIYKFVITKYTWHSLSCSSTKAFKLPEGMTKEDAYLVISAIINEYERMYNLKYFDYKIQENIINILEKYGFTIVNDSECYNYKSENINKLDIIKGNFNYFIDIPFAIYIEWYNSKANFEDIIRIYTKNNISIPIHKFTDLDFIKKESNPINPIDRNINKFKFESLIKRRKKTKIKS